MEAPDLYAYLTETRHRLFDAVRPLQPDEYRQPMPVGLGTIAEVLTHIMISEWYYVQRIEERDIPPYEQWPIQQEAPPPFDVLESTWTSQERETAATLDSLGDLGREVTYRVTTDEGRLDEVTATVGEIATQLVLHEMHHRAQVLNMLRRLEVSVGDMDYNLLRYRRRPVEE